MKISLTLLFLLIGATTYAQLTGIIRGSVTDAHSSQTLPGASVTLINSDPIIGTATDIDGKFRIDQAPAGRQSIELNFLGYEPVVIPNLQVTPGKEIVLEIEMTESVSQLREVVVEGNKKTEVINQMATVSARTFSVEESERYAGSRNDVSRMATNFAGVRGANDAVNDIVIRGNASSGLLWRMEGIDIPNPNHYGELGATGGPVSMLNTNVLSNSDFMTGAFPAEYGNATAGVFDLQVRNGNNETHEFLGQVGFNGFELGAEGPISKKKGSSYLINYRYSTLEVMQKMGVDFGTGTAIPNYQDLAFKLNFPSRRGSFSVFGLGGLSSIELLGSQLDTAEADVLYGDSNIDVYDNNNMGVIGVSNKTLIGDKTYVKLTLAATHITGNEIVDSVGLKSRIPHEWVENSRQNSKLIANAFIKRKFNSRLNAKAGIIATQHRYRLEEKARISDDEWGYATDEDGNSLLLQPYVQGQYRFSENLEFNAGVHYMYLALNGSQSLEPRAGLKYKMNQSALSAGYGLHSTMLPLMIYFGKKEWADGTFTDANKDLGFSKSHHFVAGYDRYFNDKLRFKAEAYYQHLFDVPVSNVPSPVSFANSGMPPFGYPDSLEFFVNEGRGRNYGLEFTFEQFMDRGFYYLATVSLYQSEYKGSDEVWRNTAYNSNYVVNLVGGKEFEIAPNKDNKKAKRYFVLDGKMVWSGGTRYTPVDMNASILRQDMVYDLDRSYEEQYKDYFRLDLTVGFKSIGKKFTQEWSILTQNITGYENPLFDRFDPATSELYTTNQLGFFLVPQWRIRF